MKELAEKPVYYGQKGRALVHYFRACSAYNTAKLIDGENVTANEYENAKTLLNRVTRYALADAHQFERENTFERYANSEACMRDRERLEKRRKKLLIDLARYGLTLVNFGLYPTICDLETQQPTRENISLYYFN